MTKRQYFAEIVMTRGQQTSDRTPSAGLRRELQADGLDGPSAACVERARPKIAVHNAECGERGGGRGSLNDVQGDRAFFGDGDQHRFVSPAPRWVHPRGRDVFS